MCIIVYKIAFATSYNTVHDYSVQPLVVMVPHEAVHSAMSEAYTA